MLEPTVLIPSEIPDLLHRHYRIDGVAEITPLSGGSANCWRVVASEGTFLLKEFQSAYALADISVEPRINDHLRSKGLPASRFRLTVDNEPAWVERGRAFHLQEFVEGRIYSQNTGPRWLQDSSATLLADIHNGLRDFPRLRDGFPDSWFLHDRSTSLDGYRVLQERAASLPRSVNASRLESDLAFKIDILSELELRFDPTRLTRCNSHGDYHVQQLICDDRKILAVIDFSGACFQPACWEVIRSYTYIDPACADAVIDIPNLQRYLKRYTDRASLSRLDLEAMLDLYYYQLVRSRFGFTQYLADPARHESLLRFAFWRTSMCRWLREHKAEVTAELLKRSP